jgi:site-specific recombinase XerD
MFEVIVDDYPGLTNPTKKVVLSHYEVKKGTALSKDEEKTLIEFCKANPHYQANDAMLVLMYTGMRIGELASITHDDTYITCISEKT